MCNKAIGVFDSGLGGLTVLKEGTEEVLEQGAKASLKSRQK